MRVVMAVLVALMFASESAAQDGRWSVMQVIGDVSVERPGLKQIAVKPDARIDVGATITTGQNGRVILTDGRSSITVGASSRLELPAADSDGQTAIRQDFGTAIFKVQKKPTAHFEVQTPYLAAVVKGTTFEVTVDALGAAVDVQEGLVDVGSNMTGERTLVPGGEKVRVLRSGRFDGAQPANNGRGDRQTIAGSGVISVEIAASESTAPEPEAEFAALDPTAADRRQLSARDTFDTRDATPRLENPIEPGSGAGPSPVIDTDAPSPPSGVDGDDTADRDDDGKDYAERDDSGEPNRDFDLRRAGHEFLNRAYEKWKSDHSNDRDHDDKDKDKDKKDKDKDD